MTRVLVLLGLAACVGSPPGGETRTDGAVGDGTAGGEGGGLVPGTLAVSWMHGRQNCGQSTDPELQVHAYNATTYILRQDKCRTFEAPFMYLLLGSERALLLDSGALDTPTLRDAVAPLVGARALTVAHSHGHGDHVEGDGTFVGRPGTTVVGTSRAAVQSAFGIGRAHVTRTDAAGRLDRLRSLRDRPAVISARRR